MGMTDTCVYALLKSKNNTFDGDSKKILSVGRQTNYITRKMKRRLSRALAIRVGLHDLYSDLIIENLLSGDIINLDISSYQGAEIIHDLNQPVPTDLYGLFDYLIDFGSAEHIYNIPQLFDNYSKLLKRNSGTLIMVNPANGFCGHGFYQFSPELIKSRFTPYADNIDLYLVKHGRLGDKWYNLQIMQQDERRIYWPSRRRTSLVSIVTLTREAKLENTNPFDSAEINSLVQKDYIVTHSKDSEKSVTSSSRVRDFLWWKKQIVLNSCLRWKSRTKLRIPI